MFDRKTAETTLYRQFDKDGMLLYVGISLKLGQRMSQHRRKTHWFKAVASITLQHFDTLAEALVAEKIAIDAESPLWNRMRNFAPPKPKREKWNGEQQVIRDQPYPVTFGGIRLKLLPGGLVEYDYGT